MGGGEGRGREGKGGEGRGGEGRGEQGKPKKEYIVIYVRCTYYTLHVIMFGVH